MAVLGGLPLLASALKNSDVIKMTEAGLEESIILSSVQTSDPAFDTSSEGLISLSKAKVSAKVIASIIQRNSGGTASASVSQSGKSESAGVADGSVAPISPADVVMLDGETRVTMRYLTPQVRSAARGLGFGGVASYAVLRGSSASARTKTSRPTFVVSVPNQAQPESYLTLASFAVRKNNSREVMIGGGFLSYSTGIHPDRIVSCSSEKAADQSQAQKGFTLYKLTPKSNLPIGEYAVILYTGEVAGMVSGWFTGTGNSYFDFGVDS